MSALLTPRATIATQEGLDDDQGYVDMADILAAFLRYHATEGREALVEAVALAFAEADGAKVPDEFDREKAEAVVTALVGDGGQ